MENPPSTSEFDERAGQHSNRFGLLNLKAITSIPIAKRKHNIKLSSRELKAQKPPEEGSTQQEGIGVMPIEPSKIALPIKFLQSPSIKKIPLKQSASLTGSKSPEYKSKLSFPIKPVLESAHQEEKLTREFKSSGEGHSSIPPQVFQLRGLKVNWNEITVLGTQFIV